MASSTEFYVSFTSGEKETHFLLAKRHSAAWQLLSSVISEHLRFLAVSVTITTTHVLLLNKKKITVISSLTIADAAIDYFKHRFLKFCTEECFKPTEEHYFPLYSVSMGQRVSRS